MLPDMDARRSATLLYPVVAVAIAGVASGAIVLSALRRTSERELRTSERELLTCPPERATSLAAHVATLRMLVGPEDEGQEFLTATWIP